jgi:peptidoglycan/LPS O-acetylase OafA/YrhL
MAAAEWNKGTQSRPNFAQTRASVHLDTLRGIAALLVCFGHWRYMFFADYPQLQIPHPRLWFLPYAICTLGHQSVVLFFVLSGYLVGGSVWRAVQTGRWRWSSYLLQRGVRLYIVLVPALLLCAALDHIALSRGLMPALYHGDVPNHVSFNILPNISWNIFLGNLFFLQTTVVPVFGSDSPLWSLANEFWYYLLFPCMMLAIMPLKRMRVRVLMALLFGAVFWFIGRGFLAGYVIWLLGAGLAMLPAPSVSRAVRWIAATIYALSFVVLGRIMNNLPGINPDLLLGVSTAIFLWLLLGSRAVAARNFSEKLSRTAASFSYTLYTVHFPVLTFVVALLGLETRWQPDPRHLAAGIGIVCGVIALCYVVASFTEFHTITVRKAIERRFLGVAS